MKKFMLLVIVLFVCIGVFLGKVFIWGSIMPANKIVIRSVTLSEDSTGIEGDFILESAKAFARYKYYIDNENNLHLKIYGALVSSIHKYSKFDIKINSKVNKIFIEDEELSIDMSEPSTPSGTFKLFSRDGGGRT